MTLLFVSPNFCSNAGRAEVPSCTGILNIFLTAVLSFIHIHCSVLCFAYSFAALFLIDLQSESFCLMTAQMFFCCRCLFHWHHCFSSCIHPASVAKVYSFQTVLRKVCSSTCHTTCTHFLKVALFVSSMDKHFLGSSLFFECFAMLCRCIFTG